MSKFSKFRVWAYFSRYNRWKLNNVYGMDIGYNVNVSRRVVLDYSRPPKVFIFIITGNVFLLAHDHVRGIMTDTYIGSNVFVGGVLLCQESELETMWLLVQEVLLRNMYQIILLPLVILQRCKRQV